MLRGSAFKGWLARDGVFVLTVYFHFVNVSCSSYERIPHLLLISKLLTLDSICELVEEIIHNVLQIYGAECLRNVLLASIYHY
jgi:hypothetical protein